jgi:hypothetical protein
MAQTPEGKVKAAVKAYLNTLPHCWWFMPVSNGMGSHGVPDFIVCLKGRFLGIECKAPGKLGHVTKLQDATMVRIILAGGLCLVVDDVAIVVALVRTLETIH